MPTATDRITDARDAVTDDEMPYISKSRLTTWVKCPRKFYYKYILGLRKDENYHMKKGSRIHLVYEIYYENVMDYYTEDFVDHELPSSPRDLLRFLPDDALLYADWLPYVGAFLNWELRRAAHATTLRDWLPAGIEAEAWDDEKLIPWMGFADVIVPAKGVPEVEEDDGVVIVDFKTGNTPDEKYRDEGIFLEGEYYGMLFEDEFQVAGVAGFFPQDNNFVVSPLEAERRAFIRQQIADIHEADGDKEKYPTDTGPLCRWGPGDDKCDYYDLCHAGQEWGKPAERWDEFVADVRDGMNKPQLADKYWDDDDAETDSIHYWVWKAQQ